MLPVETLQLNALKPWTTLCNNYGCFPLNYDHILEQQNEPWTMCGL
jgi:hypothetical protein